MPQTAHHNPLLPAIPGMLIDAVLAAPYRTLLIALMLIAGVGLGLRDVVKEPSVDAFVPADHPAAMQRDRARDLFGIEDPIIVLLVDDRGQSLFRSDALQAIRSMHDQFRQVAGVRRSEVISIASEMSIVGQAGDLQVDPILGEGPISAAEAEQVARRFQSMPMLLNLLGRADGHALSLIVPVDDPNHAVEVYNNIRTIGTALAPPGTSLHVAGVAGMNARLAQTVNSDTRVLIPAAIIAVLVILMISLRSVKACIGPLLVIAASALVTIGLMGWLDARYYLITTALPVVIMAMAVADCLHINLFYMRHRSEHPQVDACSALRHALARTWRPISLTSITTMAGLSGLAFGAAMQPIREFGLFAAVGVLAAWLLSLTALPSIMLLLDLRPGQTPRRLSMAAWIEAAIRRGSLACLNRPGTAIGGLLLAVLLLLGLASQAHFDYERQRYFHSEDAVRSADQALREQLGGFNFLDVMVSADLPDALMTATAQAQIKQLATDMSKLDHVVKVSAMPEYIAHMHKALTDAPLGELPDKELAPAQYLFLYEAGGEPDDFHHLIDYDHQHALIRARLDTDRFSVTQPLVRALERLTENWSAKTGLQASISGRVAVNEGWMQHLANHHFRGLAIAMLLVFAVASLAFRALTPALMAMLPVAIGVLFIYAVMGLAGIDIAPATSMSAAIATGLGVDFGIHLINHLREQNRAGVSLRDALTGDYALIARACLCSGIALVMALGVIGLSSAPPLRWFGLLVGAGATGSLVGALVLIPAALSLNACLFRWRFSHA
jgi:predicted RND superfamily exporter protein